MWLFLILTLVATFTGRAKAVAATDEYQDADPAQSGYLSNHNLHPNVVNSALFGELWRIPFNKNEKFYAKPLVYTPSAPGSRQLVILASTQNYIYAIDAINGTLIRTRQVATPFLVSDIQCSDLPNTVGIVGTPIIDPLTDTLYFFSKTYRGDQIGLVNGVYKFFAINVVNFADVGGYPMTIDGSKSDGDDNQYFMGGTHLQRPSLAYINGVVYGGFGSHCDKYNYTGWVFGIDVAKKQIVNVFTTATAPFVAPPDGTGIQSERAGSAIWHGGMGLSTDSNTRLFFVTGNGEGHQNKDTPASGKTPLLTLDEAVVNMKIDPTTGKLSVFDYFQPFDYISLDAADKDLGAAGLTLLDTNVFKGTGVSRMGVTGGKNGKAYVVNLDDLGGYKLGRGGTDNCIQSIQLDNPTFGGAGSYPLEGGYFYFSPTGSPIAAYKLGKDENGKPVFSLAGKSAKTIGGRLGPVTVTSFKNQEGTGIAWVCDNNSGLRAFYAVPENNVLTEITLPPTGGSGKFSRPAFGDGKVYMTTGSGILIALGSPVNLPLNCTDPIEFDRVTTGQSKNMTVTCVANIATKINGAVVSDDSFTVKNSSFPSAQIKKGDTFTFNVLWTPGSEAPGVKTGAINILTTNSVSKYVTSQPLNLRGIIVSSNAYLEANPGVVDFGGVIVGQESSSGVSVSFTISNTGSSDLIISKFSYAPTNQIDNTAITYLALTANSDNTYSAGPAFKLSSLPSTGQSIAPGASLTTTANFKAVNGVGNYASILKIESNGGSDKILLSGSASTAPKARFEIQNAAGQWEKKFSFDFGNVTSGSNSIANIRMCNDGGSPLIITKSKPPGNTELFATSMTDDLYEGQNIVSGQCGTGSVKFQPIPMVPNTDSHPVSDPWVLNVNDLTFGLHEVAFQGNAMARQLGPLLPNGMAQYKYLGCFQEPASGRLFPKNTNLNNNATVGLCAETGLGNKYIFAGTQYHRECWQGNTPPPDSNFFPESASKCTWSCTGDVTQPCGGDGKFMNVFYDQLRYTPSGAAISSTTTASSTSTTSTTSSSPSSTTTTTSRTTTLASTTSTTTTTSQTTTPSTTSTTSPPTTTTTTTPTTTTTTTIPATTPTTITTTPTTTTTHPPTTTTTTTTSSIILVTTTTFSTTTKTTTTTSKPVSTGPVVNDSIEGWKHRGCWLDPPDGGAKAVGESTKFYKKYTTDNMTVALCLDYCDNLDYGYAGLEYKRECYCSNVFIGEDIVDCTMPCMGNASEICGGSRRMNVYKAVDLSA
ncbi:hypothetical protein H072_10165 [Dactylellina haptotyla CBS 200.50]|uniref:WSC domain-containing protein n=1 Tax=Dactylellina haptotyla (strain CBS 200.50) TaxID=1284197 RepID=S8BB39_DACHA|nr:hypothetical protein H072_10165 [Dactylellina haptotyla CBS 200.50]